MEKRQMIDKNLVIKNIKKAFGEIPTWVFYKDLLKALKIKQKDIFVIDNEVLDCAEIIAKLSPRKRFLITLHNSLDEIAHRMINVLTKGTYAQPHMHTNINTSETFTALRGTVCILKFSKKGKVLDKIFIGKNQNANVVEIKPNTIHTIIPITNIVILLEVKGQSKYSATGDKVFFDWAPKESDDPDLIKSYLKTLRSML